MPSPLRIAALASCIAVLVAGAATSAAASASPAARQPAFTVAPSYGEAGADVTLRAASGTTFSSDAPSVTFAGTPATVVTKVNDSKLTAVVPDGAGSGEVDVQDGLTTWRGPSFTVQQATTATSSLSKAVLTYSHRVRVNGREKVAATGKPAVGQLAVVQHRTPGHHAWLRVKGTHARPTGRHGDVHWRVKPRANGLYRVYFRQSHDYVATSSGARSVQVRPRLHLHRMTTVPALATSHIRGGVHPHLGGAVYLQKRVSGHWKRVRHTTAHHGRFSFPISPSGVGQLTYRVVRRHDSTHLSAQSRKLTLQVVHRTLSLGSSGPDVLALQKRLHRLHYDVGPRNGQYGYDTLHAVTVFEKVNRLTKDGQAGTRVWEKLNNPRRVRLRHPYKSAALAVEVDLSRQVLVLARHGKVWRILDTSTGGGYYYTNSEGQSERAVTPTGHFSIQYKQTGWQHSTLGELYYPSYFTNTGYAIHGEGNGNSGSEVPPYANSHGCVRITNNAVLRYYDDLTVGTSVWVYQ